MGRRWQVWGQKSVMHWLNDQNANQVVQLPGQKRRMTRVLWKRNFLQRFQEVMLKEKHANSCWLLWWHLPIPNRPVPNRSLRRKREELVAPRHQKGLLALLGPREATEATRRLGHTIETTSNKSSFDMWFLTDWTSNVDSSKRSLDESQYQSSGS